MFIREMPDDAPVVRAQAIDAIRPGAATRMTLTDELYEARKRSWGEKEAEEWRRTTESRTPEDVSPLVVYLASEPAGNINGCVFEVRGKPTIASLAAE